MSRFGKWRRSAFGGRDRRKPDLPPPDRFVGTEGGNKNYVIGQGVRVTGNVVWMSDYLPQRSGGTTFAWDVHLAVEWAYRLPHGNQHTIKRIWAGGELIWADLNQIIRTSIAPKLGFTLTTNSGGNRARIDSPIGGDDLSQFELGINFPFAMQGWANAVNNIFVYPTFRRKNQDGSSRLDVVLKPPNITSMVNETNRQGVTLLQTLPNVTPLKAFSITNYESSSSYATEPDPLMNASIDGPLTASFRFKSATVINALKLSQFSNQVPQDWEALIQVSATTTVDKAIEDVMQASGFALSEIDTTEFTSALTLRGLVIPGLKVFKDWLHPLLFAFDIAHQEREGKQYFFRRKNATVIAIDITEAGTYEVGSRNRKSLRVTSEKETQLPSAVTVKFQDANFDNQPRAITTPSLDERVPNVEEVNLTDLVLTPEEAMAIGVRLLHTSQHNKLDVSLRLPAKYNNILPADVVTFTDKDGVIWRVLIERKEVGANGIVELEGISEAVSALLNDDDLFELGAFDAAPNRLPPQLSLGVPVLTVINTAYLP